MRTIFLLVGIFLTTFAAQAQTTRVVSTANDTGAGSLREALTSAANGDQITFAPGLANQTIRLNTQLTLNKSVTIDGQAAPGLTLSGENRTRILRIDYSFVTVTIKNLTFADGRAVDADPATKLRGGAIELLDPNTLRVENCRFLRNVGERSGAIFVGYGARATVLGCTFNDNDGSVAGDGFSAGAISTYGGGPAATVLPNGVGGQARLEVRDCTFRRNKGIVGGCIYVLLGGLQVENCLFRRSEAQEGGAIFQDGCDGTERDNEEGGTTIIRNCHVDSSLVRGLGGAFFLWGYSLDKYVIENTVILDNTVVRGGQFNDSKGGALHVRDRASLLMRGCTVARNTAQSQGGALWLDCRGPEGITLENCTFSGNRATAPNGSGDIGGAAVLNSPASVRTAVRNCTFVGNTADRADGCIWIAGAANAQNLTFTNCAFSGNRAGTTGSTREQTVNFPALSGGGNFVQSAAGGAVQNIPNATYATDLRLSPTLQTAAVGGRAVPVYSLLRTSPLIDGGVAVAGLTTDQLGTARPQDGDQNGTALFDVGAVEFVAQGGPLPVVLTHFAAQAVAEGVQLRWETTREVNSGRFVAERSADGRHFQVLGEQRAAGTSAQPRTYALLDVAPLPGLSYYRLRQIDQDGSQQFSGVAVVRRAAGPAVVALPNPVEAGGRFVVRLQQPAAVPVQLQLLDLRGRVLHHELVPPQSVLEHPVQPRRLPPGVYVLRCTSALGTHSQRLVVR